MDPWSRWTRLLWGFVDRYDQPAITLLLALEEAGLPLPLPGDVLVVLAGYRIGQGDMPLVSTALLLFAAMLVGASAMYWLGARCGRPLLYRFGRHLRLSPERLDRTGEWLRRRGALAVLLGRVTPGLRIITPLAAGAFGVPYLTFLPALAVGSAIYLAALLWIGAWFGPQALELIGGTELSVRLVLTVILFVGLGVVLLLLYRRAAAQGDLGHGHEPAPAAVETAMLAGLLATLGTALAVNVLLYSLTALGRTGPREALLAFVDLAAARLAGSNDLLGIGIIVVLVLTANLVAALSYGWVAQRLHDPPPWLSGLAVGLVPFTAWQLLLPMLGAGPFGLGLGVGLLPLVGELVRHGFFGISLGMSLALLQAARAPAADGQAPLRVARAGAAAPHQPM